MDVYWLDIMSYNHANEPKSMKKDSKAADTRNVMVWLLCMHVLYMIVCIIHVWKEKDVCKKPEPKKRVKASKEKNPPQKENHSYSRKNGPVQDIQCQTMLL